MPEMAPVRFGIVGCGSASGPVCEAILASDLTDLAAVYDVNPDLAEDLSKRFGVRRMETLEDLLSNPDVDAVYIAVLMIVLHRSHSKLWKQANMRWPKSRWRRLWKRSTG